MVADRSGAVRQVSSERGVYVGPVWSLDETQLLVCGYAVRIFDAYASEMAPPPVILDIPLRNAVAATKVRGVLTRIRVRWEPSPLRETSRPLANTGR
jgi:hypothetical protein